MPVEANKAARSHFITLRLCLSEICLLIGPARRQSASSAHIHRGHAVDADSAGGRRAQINDATAHKWPRSSLMRTTTEFPVCNCDHCAKRERPMGGGHGA
jgi:hypothetical protein